MWEVYKTKATSYFHKNTDGVLKSVQFSPWYGEGPLFTNFIKSFALSCMIWGEIWNKCKISGMQFCCLSCMLQSIFISHS